MSRLASLLAPVRRLDLDRMAALRPDYPSVAVEIDRRDLVLVRVKRRRRGLPELEAHQVRPMPDRVVGASIFRPNLGAPEELARKARELFEATGTRPGRVSLILPDNLAKISIVSLPERPASRAQLVELLRFKLRRSVPFRLEDAMMSFQVLPGEGAGVAVLVAVMLRSVVEQYERVLEAAGARPGLVDLCTPNLVNLCRHRIQEVSAQGGDVALLNAAASYFSLLILRGGSLIFYRCKSYGSGEDDGPTAASEAMVSREIAGSISYYREKLGGEGLAAVLVRSGERPVGDIAAILERLGIDAVEPIDARDAVALPGGGRLDLALAQRIAPAVGAALGRAA